MLFVEFADDTGNNHILNIGNTCFKKRHNGPWCVYLATGNDFCCTITDETMERIRAIMRREGVYNCV